MPGMARSMLRPWVGFAGAATHRREFNTDWNCTRQLCPSREVRLPGAQCINVPVGLAVNVALPTVAKVAGDSGQGGGQDHCRGRGLAAPVRSFNHLEGEHLVPVLRSVMDATVRCSLEGRRQTPPRQDGYCQAAARPRPKSPSPFSTLGVRSTARSRCSTPFTVGSTMAAKPRRFDTLRLTTPAQCTTYLWAWRGRSREVIKGRCWLMAVEAELAGKEPC